MGEMTEVWKKSIVIPKYQQGDKQKVENYRKIGLLNACYKLYSKILNEKLGVQAGKLLLKCRNGFEEADLLSIYFSMNYLYKK
jgi:hypothetical protein